MRPRPLELTPFRHWLCSRGFTHTQQGRILRHVRRHGTIAGLKAVILSDDDRMEAEDILADSQPVVPIDSPEWGSVDQGWLWRPQDDHWSLGGDPLFPRGRGAVELRQHAEDVVDWYRSHPSG